MLLVDSACGVGESVICNSEQSVEQYTRTELVFVGCTDDGIVGWILWCCVTVAFAFASAWGPQRGCDKSLIPGFSGLGGRFSGRAPCSQSVGRGEASLDHLRHRLSQIRMHERHIVSGRVPKCYIFMSNVALDLR
jgi:hypothetical protein